MKKYKKNQSGRSMVEMLAVLAISGVLSITGITAYNYAMIKHQANELVHKANLAYVDVMTRDSLDAWEELNIQGLDGTAIQGYIYNDAGFVKITDIDESICSNIIANNPGVSVLTPENTNLTTCSDTNDMIFDFGNAGTIGVKCESDTDCVESAGQYCSPHSGVCINEKECTYPTPIWSYTYDRCVTCEKEDPENPLWVADDENCIACDSKTPYYDGKNCVVCPYTTPYWNSTINTCQTCLTATPTTPIWSEMDNDCIDCATSNESTPVWNKKTKECESCPGETPHWNDESCIDCSDDTPYFNEISKICTNLNCTDGYIVTAKNGIQYCVSSNLYLYTDAGSYCTSRGMNLQSIISLGCSASFGSYCSNMTNIGEEFCVWTNTSYNSNAKYGVYLSSGFVHYPSLTSIRYALCR